MTAPDTPPIGWVVRGGGRERKLLPAGALRSHAVVTGTTGYGKSGLLLSVILDTLVHRRAGVVVLDAKGETANELGDRLLPALAERYPHLLPEHVVSVQPFGRYGLPLNPLVPVQGMDPEVQSTVVCALLGGLFEGGLGARMATTLHWLVRAALDAGADLRAINRWLVDSAARSTAAGKVRDPELRHYLLETIDQEPKATLQAIRARLDWLLRLPDVRATLCAPSCTSGAALLESPVTLIDLGGAPQGFVELGTFVGAWLFQLLTSAVFTRAVDERTRSVLLVADEWQDLARINHEEVERLLSKARYKRVALWLANQTPAQISAVSPALLQCLRQNVATQILFRPAVEDLRHLRPLLPVTGRRVDPARPDRVLTRAEEEVRLLRTLARLPKRHALLADLASGTCEVIRTLDVPYDEARRRAAALPPEVIDAYRRGRLGVPYTELRRHLDAPAAPGQAAFRSTAPAPRPKLRLP